jgi:spermidine synthase
MQKLPPLDHEYIYIADQVLQKEEQSLESMMGSSSIRGPRTEGEHTGLQMALVGLGGGMIAQYLISHSTQLSIDAIEVNADVVAAARAFFGVTRAEKHGRLRVLQGDGLSTLGESSPAMYGVVVVDCFGGSAGRMPESCRSQAFAEAVYRAMKPGGEMLQNVLISRSDDATLDKEVRRDFEELLTAYRKVFGAYAVDLQSKWEHGDNAVVRARKIGSVKEVSLLTSLLEPSE